MDVFTQMTAYDLVIATIFAVLVGRGIWLGFLKQVTGLLALYLGYYAASRYHDEIVPALKNFSEMFPVLQNVSDSPQVLFLASYVLLFVATYIVIMLLGKALGAVVSLTVTSWFDRLLGAVIGGAKAVILAVLLHVVLGFTLAPENQMLKNCMGCDALNRAADFSREFISNEELRESLLQKQPAIAIDAVKDILTPEKK